MFNTFMLLIKTSLSYAQSILRSLYSFYVFLDSVVSAIYTLDEFLVKTILSMNSLFHTQSVYIFGRES